MTYNWKQLAGWAAIGAGSGLAATLTLFVPEWNGIRLEETLNLGSISLEFKPISVGPGLVFGIVVGLALLRRGTLGRWRYPAYIAASTASYYVAYHLSILVLADILPAVFLIGIVAGAAGAGMLTALSAWMIPEFRHRRVFLATIVAGAVLGALLAVPIARENLFIAWFALFGPWQAGYAAAMTTAFEDRDEAPR